MYIRLRPGAYYDTESQIDRVVNRAMPVEIDRTTIRQLKPLMSLQAWSVYCTLLLYESAKFETKTPSLDEMYDTDFQNSMSRSEVNQALTELQGLLVNNQQILELLPPCEDLDELPEYVKNYFTDPVRTGNALRNVLAKIKERGEEGCSE